MSATRAGHRFGLVLAAIPAAIGAIYFYIEGDSMGLQIAGAFAAAIYLFCLGIGWAISALFE